MSENRTWDDNTSTPNRILVSKKPVISCEIVEKPLFKYSSLVQDICFLESSFPRRAYIFMALFSLLSANIILSSQNPVKPYHSLLFFLCYEPYSTKPTVC